MTPASFNLHATHSHTAMDFRCVGDMALETTLRALAGLE
jgi:hypothetical protein